MARHPMRPDTGRPWWARGPPGRCNPCPEGCGRVPRGAHGAFRRRATRGRPEELDEPEEADDLEYAEGLDGAQDAALAQGGLLGPDGRVVVDAGGLQRSRLAHHWHGDSKSRRQQVTATASYGDCPSRRLQVTATASRGDCEEAADSALRSAPHGSFTRATAFRIRRAAGMSRAVARVKDSDHNESAARIMPLEQGRVAPCLCTMNSF